MRTRNLVLTVIPMLILLVFGLALHSMCTSSTPTPEFVAAALRNQLNACGASLQVEFSQTPPMADGSPSRAYSASLIRTGDVIRLHSARVAVRLEQGKTAEQQNVTTDVSYDETSGEERIYACGGATQFAETGNGPSLSLSEQNPDPLFYPVVTTPLFGAISSGVVSPSMEEIDGHDCWRVEIDNSNTRGRKYIVWADPSIEFNPRRIDIINSSGKRVRTTAFSDYREIGNGVWFPYAHTDKAFTGDPDMITTNTVTSLSVGKSYAREDLLVKFPKGTKISVRGTDVTYVEP